ncbi:hypothetical protein KA013_00900 [Patescibacteria group bacterium]|nr:hypothetical protein [Patescibacteria group bacterium]
MWNDYRAGKYGKVYNSDNMRGTQYQLQQKSQIVDALFMRKVPFNSQAVHEMMADYRQRKEAYELYRQKKSGSN